MPRRVELGLFGEQAVPAKNRVNGYAATPGTDIRVSSPACCMWERDTIDD